MTYLSFLIVFLALPAAVLAWINRKKLRRSQSLSIAGLAAIALVYTTPWDNYLVAHGVWHYDPELVLGITFGWVPLEEYLFFLLQPLLIGLWLARIARETPPWKSSIRPSETARSLALAITGALWLAAVALRASGWRPGTYLGLELVWALPPIALQLGYGADILWSQRKRVALALLTGTLYLSSADALAIRSGTWTIAPGTSLEWLIGGILPAEEFLFFTLTNTLIVFGLVLLWSEASRDRMAAWKSWFASLAGRQSPTSEEFYEDNSGRKSAPGAGGF